MKVVAKNSDGYIINATYHDLASDDEIQQALYTATENFSFDYKVDNSGRIMGLADSAKAIQDAKLMVEQASKSNPILLFASQMMTDDMYLKGLLDEVAYIHSLNGYTLDFNKAVEYQSKKNTTYGFDVTASNFYTIESAKDNVINVKSTSETGNDILLPAFVEFSVEMAKGVMDGMSSLIESEEGSLDMEKMMEKQRLEIEKMMEGTDIKMTDSFNYSFDQSTQTLLFLVGTNTLIGRIGTDNVNTITEITVKKK